MNYLEQEQWKNQFSQSVFLLSSVPACAVM